MAQNNRPRSSGRRRSRQSDSAPRRFRWLRRIVVLFVFLGLLVVGGVAMAVWTTKNSLPSYSSLKASEHGQTIVVHAKDGREIVSIGPSYGRWLTYDQIPESMRGAMIAVEDRRFYDHFGVDPIGIARSVKVRIDTGAFREGGSTITQQLARNIFLNNSKTFDRKVREAILALALERKFSKEQILELYLNKVYFGGGAYGIDSASRLFFSHPATSLSIGEAAIIAGLVKAPSRYSPTADAEAAVNRAHTVLALMQQQGLISPGEAARVNLDTIELKPEYGQNSVRYFTDWVLPQLDFILPETYEPIEVWTTLDVGMQRAATTAIQSNVPKGSQGALVSLDRDGAILAMVGGTDYVESNFNRATDALRQPGSAWKLFVYLAALEAGFTPDSPVEDKPVTIDGWTPKNSGGSYAGEIDVRAAFAYSKNTVAAQLGQEVGFGTVASMAQRFGITSPISTYPSMVLGASEVRVIDMTRAFAAVNAKGTSVEPYGITRVTTASGQLLYERHATREQLLVAPYVAAQMTDLLQTAVSIGTGRSASIGRPVAGKTGTTSSNKDGWFLGFSSGITTGVWMGRDDAKRVPGLQGGTAPARAFADFMKFATAKRPVEDFDTEVKLPAWQLEPDDEAWFGTPGDYYFVDEDGNRVEPYGGGPDGEYQPPPDDGWRPGDPPRGYRDDSSGVRVEDYRGDGGSGSVTTGPRAVDDDFLDRATGREQPADEPPRQPQGRQQGASTQPSARRTGPSGMRIVDVQQSLEDR